MDLGLAKIAAVAALLWVLGTAAMQPMDNPMPPPPPPPVQAVALH